MVASTHPVHLGLFRGRSLDPGGNARCFWMNLSQISKWLNLNPAKKWDCHMVFHGCHLWQFDQQTRIKQNSTQCISFRWVARTLALRETHHGSRASHTNQIIDFQPLTWITFKALPRKIKLKGSAIVRTRWDPKKFQIVSTKKVMFIRPEMSSQISNELFQQKRFTGSLNQSLASRQGNWKPNWNSESSSRCVAATWLLT